MRQRSTFVHDPALDIDPRQLQLAGNVLKIRALKAAREERLTVGFNELPQEVIQTRCGVQSTDTLLLQLWQVLKQSHELHIRWSAERTSTAILPWASRISPGLHVSFTPLKDGTGYARPCKNGVRGTNGPV
jgi:hypothetical protein